MTSDTNSVLTPDNGTNKNIFNRVERLTGPEGLERLRRASVIVFGLGGVGSWAAEALARSGVGRITLVDADVVAASNINRQLPALLSTVGEPKVDVMARRIADINPHCEVTVRCERYTDASAPAFDLPGHIAIIDAIDSLADKASLILRATACPLPTRLFSSMGAALRMDPTQVTVDEFWRVKGDALAASLRRRFRKSGIMPRRKFKCVYSPEQGADRWNGADTSGAMTYGKAAINGAMMPVTATFGLNLAAVALRHILDTPPA